MTSNPVHQAQTTIDSIENGDGVALFPMPTKLDGDLSALLTPSPDQLKSPFLVAQAHLDDEAREGDQHEAVEDETENAADAHEEEAGYQMPHELPNIYSWIAAVASKGEHHGDEHEEVHQPWFVNPLFSIFYALVTVLVIRSIMKNKSVTNPSRAQIGLELVMGGLRKLFTDIIGPKHAHKYIPFVGSLWIFILVNNLFGLIPFFKSPTAHFQTTIALGICTFFYVNYHGFKEGGVRHYFWHLCGSPTDAISWALSPLMFLLEIIGTFVKPLSLSLRLFGNIFGEDVLLASFLGLGLMITAAIFDTATPLIGLPLHLPFLFLSLLMSTIQATVFSLLAAVYIQLLLPHDDHEHEEAHG